MSPTTSTSTTVSPATTAFDSAAKPLDSTKGELVEFPSGKPVTKAAEPVDHMAVGLAMMNAARRPFEHWKDLPPVAQQPIKLLDATRPQQTQQQIGGRIKMARGERVKLRNSQRKAQEAMLAHNLTIRQTSNEANAARIMGHPACSVIAPK